MQSTKFCQFFALCFCLLKYRKIYAPKRFLFGAKNVIFWRQSCSYLEPKLLFFGAKNVGEIYPLAAESVSSISESNFDRQVVATFSSLYRRECRRGGGTRSVDVLAKRPCPGVIMIKFPFLSPTNRQNKRECLSREY
jgi:hypothetical protein